MAVFNIQVRWSPGHTRIIGNEAADRLADAEAKAPSQPYGMAAEPTASRPPSNMKEAVRYLKALLTEPEHFESLLELTKYFTTICRR
ncbi:hypothetical protein PtrM4_074040 [Pyrenophora tritici-repentis]|uniref:RNase H type-1 domain-containing protein n=2 Tax=Pyrenophora tritici-repentis TaxID=45151 RepID=A0A834VRX0_9PLEO|nr:hypothetical protein PtrM4_074040 [Pyrenophora tritici-repentis]